MVEEHVWIPDSIPGKDVNHYKQDDFLSYFVHSILQSLDTCIFSFIEQSHHWRLCIRAEFQDGFLLVGKVWPKEHKPLHYCGGDTFGQTFPTNINPS